MSTPENWSPAEKPADNANTVLIFDTAGTVDAVWDSGMAGVKFGKIEVRQGDVTVAHPEDHNYTMYFGKLDYTEIYVATGASLIIRNTMYVYYTNFKVRKTGGGLYSHEQYEFDAAGNVIDLHVAEGTFRKVDSSLGARAIRVDAGACIAFSNSVNCISTAVLDLPAGATALFESGANVDALGGITGAGSVVTGEGATRPKLGISHKTELAAFTGTISGPQLLTVTTSAAMANGTQPPIVVDTADHYANVLFRRPAGVKFAAGIGTFYIGGFDGYYTSSVTAEDVAGEPITIYAAKSATGTSLSYSGAGDIIYSGDVTVTGSKCNMTGRFGIQEGAQLTIDDGLDMTLDNAGLGGIFGLGGSLKVNSTTDVDIPVTGRFAYVTFDTKVGSIGGLKDVSINRIFMYSADHTLTGGRAEITGCSMNSTKRTLGVSGGFFSAPAVADTKDTVSTLLKPGFIKFGGWNGVGNLHVSGGEFYLGDCNGMRDITITGGKLHLTHGFNPQSGDGFGGHADFVFNGGEAVLEARANSYNFCSASAKYTNYVGVAGGRVSLYERADSDERTVSFPNQVRTLGGVQDDGGLFFDGYANWMFGKPFGINGPVTFRGGMVCPQSDPVATGDPLFGTGTLTFDNTNLQVVKARSDGNPVQLTAANTGTFVYGGAVAINYYRFLTSPAQQVNVGRLARKGPGSVLYLRGGLSTFGKDGGDSFYVDELDATSNYRGAVIMTGTDDWSPSFAQYDAGGGFQMIPDADYELQSTFAGADEDKYFFGGATLASGTATIAGAKVDNWGWLGVSAGATLNVGNGHDPAMILSKCGGFLSGEGTIDFRGSEGILFIAYNHNDDTGPQEVRPVLAGQNGVTYTAVPCYSCKSRVRVKNANTYTGGTHISACHVHPQNALAFSTGDVWVDGGESIGGKVYFEDALVFGNDFHLSGWGWGRTGALEFAADAVLNGEVELIDDVRIRARQGKTGTLAGTVRGDRLVAIADDATGRIDLCGANTYTGGTWIVKATLALEKGSGAGTGEVVIDDGVLAFANDADIVFPNALSGLGSLRIEGEGVVRFTGDRSRLECSGTEMTRGPHRIAADSMILPFISVEDNDHPPILVLGDQATYTIPSDQLSNGSFSIVLQPGAKLVLTNTSSEVPATLYRFTGNREDVTGYFTEEHPRVGAMLIIR